MSRRVEIRFVSDSCALVNGDGTREMLTELTGRPPVWASLSRGWVAQPHRARDLIAILEHSRPGYDVTVTHEAEPPAATRVRAPTHVGARPSEGLW